MLVSMCGPGSRLYVATPTLPYVLTFPNTENPLSDGGKWTQGEDVGVVFNNIRATGGSPGFAWGVAASSSGPPPEYDDNVAVVKGLGVSTTKHYVKFRVYKPGGYSPAGPHEIEILTGFDIAGSNNRGYESSIGYGSNIQPIRQNGPIGSYDAGPDIFTTLSGATFGVAHGDDVTVLYDSTGGSPVLTYSLNDTPMWVVTDTTAGKVMSGYGGIGIFARPDGTLDLSKYGCSRFELGNG